MFAYENCMIIENELFSVYTNVHIVLYFSINDLNALNRMLTV